MKFGRKICRVNNIYYIESYLPFIIKTKCEYTYDNTIFPQIWNKWKSDVRIKMRDERKNREATGGGSPIPIAYHFLDEQLITLLSKEQK